MRKAVKPVDLNKRAERREADDRTGHDISLMDVLKENAFAFGLLRLAFRTLRFENHPLRGDNLTAPFRLNLFRL